jgi:hypothetical protein
MKNNTSDILLSKDCTASDYLYEQYFCDIISQYTKDDMIIIEQDVVPTDTIMAAIKADNADFVENAYQSMSDAQFQARLTQMQERFKDRPDMSMRLPETNNSVIYAFGICKIKSNVLNAYLEDKKAGILPAKINWLQFYDIFYAWYIGFSYNGKKFANKGFAVISQLNSEVGVHNK